MFDDNSKDNGLKYLSCSIASLIKIPNIKSCTIIIL